MGRWDKYQILLGLLLLGYRNNEVAMLPRFSPRVKCHLINS